MGDIRLYLPYVLFKPIAILATILALPLLLVLFVVRYVSVGKRQALSTRSLWAIINSLGYWGRLAFSQLIYFIAPYTGSIDMLVEDIAPGHCEASVVQHYGLQNPFRSVHAVALVNLGEFVITASFLTLIKESKPKGSRAIPVAIRAEYYKKARGKLVARCDVAASDVTTAKEQEFRAGVFDRENVKVCDIWVRFNVDIHATDKEK